MANVGTGGAGKTLIGTGNTTSPTFDSIGTLSGLTANGLLVAQGNNPFTVVAPAQYGVLISNVGDVPSWLANGTTGQVFTATTGAPPSWQTLMLTDLHTAKFIVGDTTRGANYATVAAAYAAANTLGAPQTVYLQDGVYPENITGIPGINISSFGSSGIQSVQLTANTPNVVLQGTFAMTYAGTVNAYGIQFKTNGAAAIASSGSNAASLNCTNCSLNAFNATGMTLNNASSTVNWFGSTFTNSGTNALFAETNSSGMDFENCSWSTNGTSAANTLAVARALFQACDMHGVNFVTSGTGSLFVNSCYWQYGDQILLTMAGTGTSEIYNTYMRCDNASAVSVGSGCTVNMADVQVLSTATNALTGAGTIQTANVSYQSSFVNNVSTKNSYPVEKIYSPSGITFDNMNVMANYVDKGTFTPTLIGGSTAGSTTYSNQNGYYTRIGNLVFVTADIAISAATGTGAVTLGNLPFTINNQTNGYVNGAVFWQGAASWIFPTGATSLSCLGLPNTTTALVWGAGTGIAGGFMQMANAALQVSYSLVYQI